MVNKIGYYQLVQYYGHLVQSLYTPKLSWYPYLHIHLLFSIIAFSLKTQLLTLSNY